MGDLVICEEPDRSTQFKVVKGIPKTYFYDIGAEMEYYVPSGFVVVYDPLSKETKMVHIFLWLGMYRKREGKPTLYTFLIVLQITVHYSF